MSKPASASAALTELVSKQRIALSDLARGALTIASCANPSLDISAYLNRLEDFAKTISSRLSDPGNSVAVVRDLNVYLFDELRFTGNQEDYYDPKNSFLNEVIERRRGIPITLSVIYLDVGWRLGLPLSGVSFPGHFLVKYDDGAMQKILDPFARGQTLSGSEVAARLRTVPGADVANAEKYLVAATNREIWTRMLRNLKSIYLQRQELEQALLSVECLLALDNEDVDEIRDRGVLYERLECFQAARADYEHYLALAPHARDAATIRARLNEMRKITSRFH